MKERVKALRKELNLTMEKFGSYLGVGKTAISKIEKGENNLTDQMIKAICNVNWSGRYVNENYLRGNSDQMFVESDTFDLGDFAKSHCITELETEIVKTYLELDLDTRHKLIEHFKKHFFAAPATESLKTNLSNTDTAPVSVKRLEELSNEEIGKQYHKARNSKEKAMGKSEAS